MELLDYTQTKLKLEKVREDASEDRGEMNQQQLFLSAENGLLGGTLFRKSHFDRMLTQATGMRTILQFM